jgi:hypothetical protein
MRGARVLLDLNFPAFQDDLLGLDANELRPILKTLRKLKTLDWEAVYRDPGIKWEQVKEAKGKFAIRLSLRSRALVRPEGDYMRFVAIHTEHDAAYGKK